ncbi:MAG: DUF4386 domain-containing protein [Bacteroidota bacterium]
MSDRNKTARIAGLWYLVIVITGVLNLMYIPSLLIDKSDPAGTLATLQESEFLFRIGIVCGIICYLAFIGLAFSLYKLLHQVHLLAAQLMMVFVMLSIPISFVNILNKFEVLNLISDRVYVAELSQTELQFQVMHAVQAFSNGINLSQIFWGLWLFPFGYLVYQSGFLPKFFGILLMLGCVGYLITFFGGFLYNAFYDTMFAEIVGIPASVGEIGICLWLLIMGTNKLPFRRTSQSFS